MMIRVQIELWLWLSDELKGDFEFLSPMRCLRKEEVPEGTAIGQLLEDLAKRYPPLGHKVYSFSEKKGHPYWVVNVNERVSNPYVVYEQLLKDGDKITVLPMYVGG